MDQENNLTPELTPEQQAEEVMNDLCRDIIKNLQKNRFTKLVTPKQTFNIIRPYPAILLKRKISPWPCYSKTLQKLFPDHLAQSLYENRSKKPADLKKEEDQYRASVILAIGDLITSHNLTPEYFNSLDSSTDGRITQTILVRFVLGRLEPVTSEDLLEYADKYLSQDALAFETPVSHRLKLTGTLPGYDIDLAGGLYRHKERVDNIRLDMKFQASLVGAKLDF